MRFGDGGTYVTTAATSATVTTITTLLFVNCHSLPARYTTMEIVGSIGFLIVMFVVAAVFLKGIDRIRQWRRAVPAEETIRRAAEFAPGSRRRSGRTSSDTLAPRRRQTCAICMRAR